ncbi:MAG: Cupin 2 barrel domain-containing protein, partial [uncultured Chloroflexi bacterium]
AVPAHRRLRRAQRHAGPGCPGPPGPRRRHHDLPGPVHQDASGRRLAGRRPHACRRSGLLHPERHHGHRDRRHRVQRRSGHARRLSGRRAAPQLERRRRAHRAPDHQYAHPRSDRPLRRNGECRLL